MWISKTKQDVKKCETVENERCSPYRYIAAARIDISAYQIANRYRYSNDTTEKWKPPSSRLCGRYVNDVPVPPSIVNIFS